MNPSNRRPLALALALALGPAALAMTQCHPPPSPPAQVTSNSTPEPGASSALAPAKPAPLAASEVDRMLGALWEKEKIAPTPLIDDTRFLRRVSLDLRGVIPSPEEIEKYLAQPAAERRQKAVDAMLEGPRFANHWTNYWDRVLMGRDTKNAIIDRVAFRGWVHQKLAANAPWDRLVYELVTATGQNRADDGDTSKVNGAVNWLLKYRDSPADLTGATSRVFLGVQIQCAQCHDHKTEKWKTEDFQKLAACFMQTRGELVDREGRQKRFDVVDVDKVPRGPARKNPMMAPYITAKPGAIDGTDFSASPNRRQALGSWLTSPKNPWFAQAIVNRMWGHFFGRGVVDPVDDFRESNPPVAPELLARVAEDFVAQGHDLKKLMKLLVSTQAYQRAPAPRAENPAQGRLWARYRLMPLGPDELLDSLVAATKVDALLARSNEDELDRIRMQVRNQFNTLFDVDEEDPNDDFDGTIPQALMLLNGRVTNAGSSALPGTALAEVLALPGGDDVKIKALYLRTLSREPASDEVARWVAFLDAPREAVHTAGPAPEPRAKGKGKKNQRPDPLAAVDRQAKKGPRGADEARRQAYEDLLWALLNSSEFYFNH